MVVLEKVTLSDVLSEEVVKTISFSGEELLTMLESGDKMQRKVATLYVNSLNEEEKAIKSREYRKAKADRKATALKMYALLLINHVEDALYEDVIIKEIGMNNFKMLVSMGKIETCSSFNSRKLYAL